MFVTQKKYDDLEKKFWELARRELKSDKLIDSLKQQLKEQAYFKTDEKGKFIKYFERYIKDSKIHIEHNDFCGDYYAITLQNSKGKNTTFNVYQQYNSDCGLIYLCNVEKIFSNTYLKDCWEDILKIVEKEYNAREEYKRLSQLSKKEK